MMEAAKNYSGAATSFGEAAVKSGLTGGLLGGIVMTFLAMAGAPLIGQDIWAVAKNPVLASEMHAGLYLPALLGGQFAHLMISALWGLAFSLALVRLNPTERVIAGPIWGLAAMLVTYYVTIPLAGITLALGNSERLLATIQFLFFGATLGAVSLMFDDRVPRQTPLHHWHRRPRLTHT